jgi:hypothetical protein
MAAVGQRVGLQMVLDAEGYVPPSEAEMQERQRRLAQVIQIIATSVSPEDRGPGRLKRRAESPEEQERKEQILTNPGKGILAGLREMTEANHAAAE